MPIISVTIKAVHTLDRNRFFAAKVTATNLNNGRALLPDDIPQEGGAFELETGARYKIVADPREGNFQPGERPNIRVTASTRTVLVSIPPMGEECRIWLEDIKRMIEKGQHQKAKRNIQRAKKVYQHLTVVPEEIIKIFALEKELPSHIA